jgi:hypothetical protein
VLCRWAAAPDHRADARPSSTPTRATTSLAADERAESEALHRASRDAEWSRASDLAATAGSRLCADRVQVPGEVVLATLTRVSSAQPRPGRDPGFNLDKLTYGSNAENLTELAGHQ